MPAIDLFGSFFFFFLYSNTFSLSWLLSIYRWNIEPLSAGTPTVQHKKHTHTHTNTRAVACQTLHWRRIVFHLSLFHVCLFYLCVLSQWKSNYIIKPLVHIPPMYAMILISKRFSFSPPPRPIVLPLSVVRHSEHYISRHGDLIPFHHVL